MEGSDKKTKAKKKLRLRSFKMRMIGSSYFQNDAQELLFGHPSVESVAKRFSNTSQHLDETTDAPIETYHKERINVLVQDFNDVQEQLD
ncbi:hypothetical protein Goshw_002852, partial [Gossypium schwendimanii]|nr:hypothetical protein [Gossypium schwendimanii]